MPTMSIGSQLGLDIWKDQRWKGSEVRLDTTEIRINEI